MAPPQSIEINLVGACAPFVDLFEFDHALHLVLQRRVGMRLSNEHAPRDSRDGKAERHVVLRFRSELQHGCGGLFVWPSESRQKVGYSSFLHYSLVGRLKAYRVRKRVSRADINLVLEMCGDFFDGGSVIVCRVPPFRDPDPVWRAII